MILQDYIDLSNEQINQFELYSDLLLEWNEKFNLTAITDKDEIILKHFIDSLTISKYIDRDSKLVDVGTGAGFPGIPLKIYYKDLNVTLVDSLNKRVSFLQELINKLGLVGATAIHSRAEELANNVEFRECYDFAVARAVANLSTLLEYLMPFVKVGGKCICMKGPNVDNELILAKNALVELGGEIEKVDNFKVANSDLERNLVIVKKVKSTNKKYPRKAGTPSKSPL